MSEAGVAMLGPVVQKVSGTIHWIVLFSTVCRKT